MINYTELNTIRDFIRIAVSQFNAANIYYGHGTENAWDDAVSLILHTLHLPHDINPAVLDANLTSEEKKQLSERIYLRVTKRLPVPYITHEAWFAGLSFYVDERVLIPRSPIAELIENQFQPWIKVEEIKHILDVCTGSGCIAIACSEMFPEALVDASDISKEALSVAKINILRHNLEEHVNLIESDLFNAIPKNSYDIIISNPPYVSTTEIFDLPPEYLHEPRLGLLGGESGLDHVINILQHANDYLSSHGILIIEVGNSDQALIELFPEVPFTWLEFERGGDGVFLLTKEQLKACQDMLNDKISTRSF